MSRADALVTLIDADDREFDLYTPEAEGPFIILQGATGFEMAAVELDTPARVGPGSSFGNVRFPERTIVLPMYCEDLDELEEFREAIPDRPNRLRITTPNRQRELTDVYYVAGLEGVDGPDTAGADWRRFNLELRVLNPLYLDEEESITLFPPEVNDLYDAALPYDSALPYDGPGAGISAGRGYDEPVSYDAPLPYNGGGTVSPVITSRLGAWPMITFHGPALSFEVTHQRTGERIASIDTLTSGVEIVVTTTPGSRDITVDGQPAWDRVTTDSSAEFQFLPGDGLTVLMTGTTDESRIDITWRQMWRQP